MRDLFSVRWAIRLVETPITQLCDVAGKFAGFAGLIDEFFCFNNDTARNGQPDWGHCHLVIGTVLEVQQLKL